ncbi:LOW QUALITY PROTEIN: uncharacterized protein LOC127805765 [Diospyros lotus]|uniref:LOW QUALITY PROTEIN: uncharacterized protein LOC127805765 n=1 Tax=Diospyros lotus TaxID=55363 RepID=UPI00224D71BF|nr:LOW QUALITY PROTEIN: uncharacterized protein LOC127805765 [Diospyros lotus]
MARIHEIPVLALSALLLFSWLGLSHCSKKPVGVARKEDIPYIKCQVCEKLAHQLHHQVLQKQAQISPKKISEYQIIEISENVCNLNKQEADWILKIDIVEQGDKLELIEQDTEGQCNSECKTIERTCQEIMGYSDTDVAEYLYKNKPQVDHLTRFLCNDLSSACRTKPPPVPKDRIPGEPFVAKSSKEAEMDKLLKSMEGVPGAPGMKMYSREELMNSLGGGGDADEDDDDEAGFPSEVGRVLREKENTKSDWKERISRTIVHTGQALKKHANKVSYRIQRWWRGRKSSLSKKKSSKTSKPEL